MLTTWLLVLLTYLAYGQALVCCALLMGIVKGDAWNPRRGYRQSDFRVALMLPVYTVTLPAYLWWVGAKEVFE